MIKLSALVRSKINAKSMKNARTDFITLFCVAKSFPTVCHLFSPEINRYRAITELKIISNDITSFEAFLSSVSSWMEKSPRELLTITVINRVIRIIKNESIKTARNFLIKFIFNELNFSELCIL